MINSTRIYESLKYTNTPNYHLIFGTLLLTAGLEELGCYFGTNIRPSVGFSFAYNKLSDMVNYSVDYFRPGTPGASIKPKVSFPE